MKRTVAMVMAVLLMVGMLTGCGTNASDKNENGQTVISVGSWPSKDGQKLEILEGRKAMFEELNPDAVIEPDHWEFDRRTFYAKAAGGQLPTVYLAGFTEMPEIISSDLSADISKALKKHGYEGMFNESVLNAVSDGEKILAFPTNCYVLGLALNTELFDAAGLLEEDGTPKQPKDWNELVEFAVKIKETTGKAGIVVPTAENYGGWYFTMVAWSFGADFMEKDETGKWKATINTPEVAETLQWYKDLRWKYDVLPSNALVTKDELYKNFGTGNAAMVFAGGGISSTVVKYGMTPEQLGMMAIPAGPKRHVTLLGGDVQAINANATEDQIDAAIRWLETEHSFELTDEYKKTTEDSIKLYLDENRHVGIHTMSVWNEDAPSLKWYKEYLNENCNANPNHVRLYNEFVANPTCEIQAEEPVCCQELYAILDGCIQEVLSNKDANVTAILEKANNDFQINYLDAL